MAGKDGMVRMVLVLVLVLTCWMQVIAAANTTNVTTCSFSAVYAFGDSLIDVGNAIAAFPNQFAYAEESPNGVSWPSHSADRMSDGKLLVDFISFGGTLGPTYPWFRSIATDLEFGTNFGCAGATAENQTEDWTPDSGFNTPFSLDIQLQWLRRYKVRLEYYYNQTWVNQSLPEISTLNTSVYMVQAGFQDYFFPLYYKNSTTKKLLKRVPKVVSAISDMLEGLADFGATAVFVVNVPPIGCFPALLTVYPKSSDKYDSYGCLKSINNISTTHNAALEEQVISLRSKYPNVTYYLLDFYSAYTDILADPAAYNITETLKACCGSGGSYNFNKEVTCSEVGKVGNQQVNLTVSTCSNPKAYLSWDGIHPSHAANRAAATDFFNGKHITPSGFGCVVNTTQFS